MGLEEGPSLKVTTAIAEVLDNTYLLIYFIHPKPHQAATDANKIRTHWSLSSLLACRLVIVFVVCPRICLYLIGCHSWSPNK